MLLLIVEDDLDLAAAIMDFLELEGIDSDYANNGESALNMIRDNFYDAIVLDLNLPKVSGLEVCETIRSEGKDVPIIMLTAMDTLQDKLQGFEKGADDYLIKPFDMEELVIRTKVLSKRRSGQVSQIKVGSLVYKFDQQIVTRDGKLIKLSPTSIKLLEVLMRASPSTVSREKLIRDVWGDDPPDSNSLKVHMFKLRKQIETGFESKMIHTVSGKGFALRESLEQ